MLNLQLLLSLGVVHQRKLMSGAVSMSQMYERCALRSRSLGLPGKSSITSIHQHPYLERNCPGLPGSIPGLGRYPSSLLAHRSGVTPLVPIVAPACLPKGLAHPPQAGCFLAPTSAGQDHFSSKTASQLESLRQRNRIIRFGSSQR